MPVRFQWGLAVALGALVPLGTVPTGPAQAAVQLSPCVNPDNTDPAVTSVTLSRSAVDTTDGSTVVELSVQAADAGGPGPASGVASVTAQLWGPLGADAPEDPVALAQGPSGDWAAQITVPRGAHPGTYAPYLSVADRAGNQKTYWDGGNVPVPGHPQLTVASVADTVPPQLLSLRLSDTSVDTRRHASRVVVTARVTDDSSGVKRILVDAGDDRRGTFTFLHRVAGTAHDGRWRGTLVLPRWLGTHTTWRLTRVALVDELINVRNYTPRTLRLLAVDHPVDRAVRVRSSADLHRPTASPATLSTPSIDVRLGTQEVTVRVRARDDIAGVRAVRVRLLDPLRAHEENDTFLRLVSGTRRNGTWEATLTFPTCSTFAGTWDLQIKVTDRAGRTRQHLAEQPTLEVRAPDNIWPNPDRTSYAAGSPVLDFSEDVTGLTTTSAVVQDADGHDVTGSWSCTTASGSTADCATGAFRRATFTMAPTVPGQLFVVLNPEGTLGVTDLAGNPAGRRYRI